MCKICNICSENQCTNRKICPLYVVDKLGKTGYTVNKCNTIYFEFAFETPVFFLIPIPHTHTPLKPAVK